MTAPMREASARDFRRENGMALAVAMMALALMMALGVGLVLTTSAETMVAGNFSRRIESVHAADAGLERALGDLAALPDWNLALSGAVRSTFVDGPPSGLRTAPGGATIDLARAQNEINCGQAAACTDTDMDAVTVDRPWGSNNPRWQLYAYGSLADLLPGAAVASAYYVAVFIADDQSENDNDPLRDAGNIEQSGAGVITLRAEAFGARGSHAVVEATVARVGPSGGPPGYTGEGSMRLLSWREVR